MWFTAIHCYVWESFNPVSTMLCYMIYYHSDQKGSLPSENRVKSWIDTEILSPSGRARARRSVEGFHHCHTMNKNPCEMTQLANWQPEKIAKCHLIWTSHFAPPLSYYTVQSRFSYVNFSGNLWFSDYYYSPMSLLWPICVAVWKWDLNAVVAHYMHSSSSLPLTAVLTRLVLGPTARPGHQLILFQFDSFWSL